VELLAYWAEIETGELRLVDHDAVAWVAPSEALSYALAPADIPLVQEIVKVLR